MKMPTDKARAVRSKSRMSMAEMPPRVAPNRNGRFLYIATPQLSQSSLECPVYSLTARGHRLWQARAQQKEAFCSWEDPGGADPICLRGCCNLRTGSFFRQNHLGPHEAFGAPERVPGNECRLARDQAMGWIRPPPRRSVSGSVHSRRISETSAILRLDETHRRRDQGPTATENKDSLLP